jgi:hypothetical protein
MPSAFMPNERALNDVVRIGTTRRVISNMCVFTLPATNHVYVDLGSGSPRAAVLFMDGEYTSRDPGFVPVANVQLLIPTPAVLSSLFMTSSLAVHFAQADYATAASPSWYLRMRR